MSKHWLTMIVLSCVVGCSSAGTVGEGEGEGESNVGEGEGEGVVGEGEGEGEGDVGEGEGEPMSCALPDRYPLFFRDRNLVVVDSRTIDVVEGLTNEEQARFVQSFRSPAIANAQQGFDAIDDSQLHITRLYELSSGANIHAYEYGRGDTSVGMVFAEQPPRTIALINDGDIEDCSLRRGTLGIECEDNDSCSAPRECLGAVAAPSSAGVCVDLREATGPGVGSACTVAGQCALGQRCAGLGPQRTGTCLPAWTAGTFVVNPQPVTLEGAISDVEFVVSGLATVDTEVFIEVLLFGNALAQSSLMLRSPSAEHPLFSVGDVAGGEFAARLLVPNFSGDASVNGQWSLVLEQPAGAVAELNDAVVFIGSRFD
jgi:hypothetical protein